MCMSLKVLCGSVDAVQLFVHEPVCFPSSLVRAADLILQVVIRFKIQDRLQCKQTNKLACLHKLKAVA